MFVLKEFLKRGVFMLLRSLAVFFLFFNFAQTTFAQVEITEIMYDLKEGGDGGREWVEIHNVGGSLVDISDWRFFEAETNHKLKIISGDGALGVGEYAVIVSDDVKFYIDNPTFSGDVLDSSFSLSNTGELLIIRDTDLNDINSVTYSSEWGAKGDGNSLQKVNGSWCAGAPTPGAANVNVCAELPNNKEEGAEENPPNNGGGQQEQEPPADYSKTMPSWAKEPKISTYAGARKRVMIAGASTDFIGKAGSADDKPLLYARYLWSFGDGSTGEGKEVTHTYYYPGEYVVVLNTASGGYAAMDRVSVEVISADLAISNVSFDEPSFIEIYNKTSYELDLSQWKIKSGKQMFTLPQDTFIKPKKKIIFPSQVTKLSIKKSDKISFLYPSGDIVTSYDVIKDVSVPSNEVSSKAQTTQPASDHIEEKVVTKGVAYDDPSSYNTVKSEGSSILGYVSINSDEEKPASATSLPAGRQGFGEAKEKLAASGISGTAQAASVPGGAGSRKNNKEDGLFWGIMGISLISLIAIYGVLISKEKKKTIPAGNEASLYKIIEIKD